MINRFNGGGIRIQTNGDNIIEGNRIGTDPTGTMARPNINRAVNILNVPNNRIGGTAPSARNLISGNAGRGVYIQFAGATGNVVQNNYIGTDASGTTALPNTVIGVIISTVASNNLIGGTEVGARNVISGNSLYGVGLFSSNNRVEGNFIGTDATGTADLGNNGIGIQIFPTGDNNVVGGLTPAARNVISGNGGGGIAIFGSEFGGQVDLPTNNAVQGNYIGTDVTGTQPIGNEFDGVYIANGASDNTIGGIAPGAGNIIAHNELNGVIVFNGDFGPSTVLNSPTNDNSILSNAIFANGALGIDLSERDTLGVTPNDVGDADTGSNNLQNFPILSSVTSSGGGTTTVQGMLNGTPNTTFTIQFFVNSACDPSGNGEGQVFVGSTTVTTDGGGNVNFTVASPTAIPSGQFITTTATDANNNTSEFSQCIQVPPPIEPISVVLSRDASGQLQATITITNPLAEPVPDVTLTIVRASTLDQTAFVDGVPVPQAFGTINPGQSVTAMVVFPGTAGVPSGFAGLVRVELSFTGGTYTETKQVVTP